MAADPNSVPPRFVDGIYRAKVGGWVIEAFAHAPRTVYIDRDGQEASIVSDGDLRVEVSDDEQPRGYGGGSPEVRYIPMAVVLAAHEAWKSLWPQVEAPDAR